MNETAAPPQHRAPRAALELDDRRQQAPANGEPDCDRNQERRQRQADPRDDEEHDRAEERPDPAQRDPVGLHRADRPTLVDLDERARRRGLDEPEPEERHRAADRESENGERSRPLTRDDAEQVDQPEHEPLHERRHDRDRDQEHADPEEEAPAVARTCAPRRR